MVDVEGAGSNPALFPNFIRMIKGRQKAEIIKYDEVLQRTSGGYDIYRYYEGKVPKLMSCPWRRDRHPSFGFFSKDGLWFWKDLKTEETGTAIDYMMKKFGLSFSDAIGKILYDFGWNSNIINANPVIINWEAEEPKKIHISFSSKPFEKRHHEFWNCAGVSEIDCNKKECWAIKDLAINRKIIRLGKDEIGFAYYCPEEEKVKIYLPDRPKENRFYNSVSYFHLWNFTNVQECDDLIVQKSMKDLIVTSVITPCVTATQAEATKIFNDDIVSRINSIAKNIWVWYGSDEDGVEKCKKITNQFRWKYINTPKRMLPDINDTYGMAKKYGIKAVEEFMKSKKFPL